MIPKPCVRCGELTEQSRCQDCRNDTNKERATNGKRTAAGARWKRLSIRLRKLQPWCDHCGTSDDLTVDHIIPVSERPDLEFKVENCRILCRPENAARGNRVTPEERAEVERRLLDKRRRRVGANPHPDPQSGRSVAVETVEIGFIPDKEV